MPKTITKPRWVQWEQSCLEVAFHQKIQLKIIARALQKTLNSVNKKIGALKLRSGKHQKEENLPWHIKTPQDVTDMLTILAHHAPEGEAAQRKEEFAKLTWAQPLNGKDTPERLAENARYICGIPLTPATQEKWGVAEIKAEPEYVSLQYVETWAASQGFYPLSGPLLENGYRFWKDGQYFSRTHMIMHINRLRLAENLKPLYLQSEEEDAQNLEEAQEQPAEEGGT